MPLHCLGGSPTGKTVLTQGFLSVWQGGFDEDVTSHETRAPRGTWPCLVSVSWMWFPLGWLSGWPASLGLEVFKKSWHIWPSKEHIATPCSAVMGSSFMIWNSFLLMYFYSQWSKTCKALCLKNHNLQVLITSMDFKNPSEITPWGINDFPLKKINT